MSDYYYAYGDYDIYGNRPWDKKSDNSDKKKEGNHLYNEEFHGSGKDKHKCQKCGRKECECKEVCDCCCTPGLLEELQRLIGTGVLITTKNGDFLLGTLVYADCNVARMHLTIGVISENPLVFVLDVFISISICEIDTVLDTRDPDPGALPFSEEVKQLLNNKKGES